MPTSRSVSISKHRAPAPRTAAVAVLALAGLVLSACSSAPSTDTSPPPETTLEAFYQQQVTFSDCQIPVSTEGAGSAVDGTCGTIEVPIDYNEPAGDTAELAVFRVPARGGDSIGSLLLNPGGPGSAGIGFAASSALALADDPVSEQYDLVGFDPRGVGASTPAIDCFTDAERDTDVSPASALVSPLNTRPLVEACADSVGGVEALAHMGTVEAARDLDVMRQVLGDEKLSFAGVSYGTRLGAVYAQTFPDKVRSLVLDGPVDPLAETYDRRIDQFTGLQGAFDDLAAFCIEQGDCPLGDTVAGATTRYQQLVQPLQDAPLPTVQGRDLTFTSANDAVVAGLYSKASWPAVIDGLSQLAEGRGDLLRALRDISQGRAADGTYTNAQEAIVVYNCLDETRFSEQGQIDMIEALHSAAPIFDTGRPVEGQAVPCAGWPSEPTLEYPYAVGIENLPPTLAVAVTGDPLAPYDGAMSLADTLGSALLTVEGDRHGVIMSGNECVDAIVASYLIDGDLPRSDVRCQL